VNWLFAIDVPDEFFTSDSISNPSFAPVVERVNSICDESGIVTVKVFVPLHVLVE
jgi:hypothetical protein